MDGLRWFPQLNAISDASNATLYFKRLGFIGSNSKTHATGKVSKPFILLMLYDVSSLTE